MLKETLTNVILPFLAVLCISIGVGALGYGWPFGSKYPKEELVSKIPVPKTDEEKEYLRTLKDSVREESNHDSE
jgi:hypothetical protein